MIKGDCFGKLLKQLFSIGLISCFTLLVGSSVSAYYSVGTSNSTCVRNYNGYYNDLPCENNCSVNSDMSFSCSSSNSKIIYTNYANGHQTAYYWTPNGLARYYVQNQGNGTCGSTTYSDWINQYLFTGFTLCEGEYYPNSSPNNPSCPGSGQILSYFEMLNYVKSHGGLIGYDFTYYHGNVSDFGLSFIGNGYYFQSVLGGSSSVPAYGNVNNNPYWGNASPYNLGVSSSCSTGNYKVLLDSSFPDVISNPMRLAGGGNIPNTGVNSKLWCKKSTALNWYDKNGYSSKLCYGGLSDYSTTTGVVPIYGQGLDVVDIRANTCNKRINNTTGDCMEYDVWFGYWRDLYNSYKKGMISTNPFSGLPTVLLTYFGAVDSYGLPFSNDSIIEYCDLKINTVNYDVVYTGVNFNNVCKSPIEIVDDQLNDTGFNNGGVNNGVDWGGIFPGIGNLTGSNGSGSIGGVDESGNITNGTNFIQDFFENLKENFEMPEESGNGFLPTYIIIALLGIIFFRFLKH